MQQIQRFLRDNAAILWVLMAAQVAVFSYFYFGPILTNHSFPNLWVQPYPSFKTMGEGRWLADLIIQAQGGSGVQSLQMFAATALQAVNGVLFARLCGLTRRGHVGLAAGLLCLYPAFLDYYAFTIDHLTFVLGDTLALLGLRAALLRRQSAPDLAGLALAAACFALALACYQPKIALVATLCVVFFARKLAQDPAGATPLRVLAVAGQAIGMAVAACGLYYISVRLTLTYDIGNRAYINTPAQMLAQAGDAYGQVLRYFWTDSAYMPFALRGLPLVAAGLGAVAMLPRLAAGRGAQVLALLVMLAVLPLALRASYIINETTWVGAGRITFAHGYALVFLASGLLLGRLWRLGAGLFAALLYFCAITDAQETNAAAIKADYETAMINRIAGRIESAVPDLLDASYPVVVFGYYPAFPRERFLRSAYDLKWVHTRSPVFERYRQTEVLNFYLGKDVLQIPTKAQVAQAALAAQGRLAWPAPQSVFVQDGVIVVLLEPYSAGLAHTWTSD